MPVSTIQDLAGRHGWLLWRHNTHDTGEYCQILVSPDAAVPGLARPEHGGPLHGAGAGIQRHHGGGLHAAAGLPQAQASVQSGAALGIKTELL